MGINHLDLYHIQTNRSLRIEFSSGWFCDAYRLPETAKHLWKTACFFACPSCFTCPNGSNGFPIVPTGLIKTLISFRLNLVVNLNQR